MDWPALISAAIGGSVGALLTGWLDRRARSQERDADFQRDTLSGLLDTLEALMSGVQAVEQWRREPDQWRTAIEEERATLPDAQRASYVGRLFDEVEHLERLVSTDGPLERMTNSRLRMEKLANQVKDEQVRTLCYRLSVVARETMTQPAYERAVAMIGPMSERIGALLRGEPGIMLDLGTTSDAKSTRRLL